MPKSKRTVQTKKMAPRAALPIHDRKSKDSTTPTRLALTLMPSGHIVMTELVEDITIGRKMQNTSALAHIDLTPYGAHDRGVSRLHVRISLHANGVAIQDLGSTNGTFINEYRLVAFTKVDLQDGDLLEIGEMAFRVSFVANAAV